MPYLARTVHRHGSLSVLAKEIRAKLDHYAGWRIVMRIGIARYSAIADVARTVPSSWRQGFCNTDGDENAALVTGPVRVRGCRRCGNWLKTVRVSGLRDASCRPGVKKPA
jgi:hypothetical protein